MQTPVTLWLAILVTLFGIIRCFDFGNLRSLSRQSRILTYPPTSPTRIQFICGIGIPVEDLYYESITTGYVVKAEYFLPETADETRPTYLRPQRIHRRETNVSLSRYDYYHTVPHHFGDVRHMKKTTTRTANNKATSSNFNVNRKSKQKSASQMRWNLYKSIEMVFNNTGLPGHVCALRSICEHAAAPLHFDSGLWGELLHIMLTPSSSRETLSKPSDVDYLQAETNGRSGVACDSLYSKCHLSPMDRISAVFDWTDNDFF